MIDVDANDDEIDVDAVESTAETRILRNVQLNGETYGGCTPLNAKAMIVAVSLRPVPVRMRAL